jgi:hypothetical protein
MISLVRAKMSIYFKRIRQASMNYVQSLGREKDSRMRTAIAKWSIHGQRDKHKGMVVIIAR